MPFTPYHLGPASLAGLMLSGILDLPALLIASVIIDIEPLGVLVFNLDYPMHGFFHSFLGGSLAAGLTAVAVNLLKGDIRKLMVPLKLDQDSSFKKIFWTSLFGVYFHVLLDSPLYVDMSPFYPYGSNPFYGLFSPGQIYLASGFSFLIAIGVYLAGPLVPHARKLFKKI